MKKDVLIVLAIIGGFVLIQTVKLGGWNGNDSGPLLVQADDSTFRDKVEESGEWTLVKFWAPWCESCRKLMPTVVEIAEERRELITVIAVNVDEAPSTANAFGVDPIPSLVLMQDTTEVDRMVGVTPKPVLTAWIDGHIARESTASK